MLNEIRLESYQRLDYDRRWQDNASLNAGTPWTHKTTFCSRNSTVFWESFTMCLVACQLVACQLFSLPIPHFLHLSSYPAVRVKSGFLHHLHPWGHKAFQLPLFATFHWETSTAKHLPVEQSPLPNTMTPEKRFQRWGNCLPFTIQMDLKKLLGVFVTTFDVGPSMTLHQWHTGRHVTNVTSALALTCPAQMCRTSSQRPVAGTWLLFVSLEPYLKASPSFP